MNAEQPKKKKASFPVDGRQSCLKFLGPSWLVKWLLPALAIVLLLDIFITCVSSFFNIVKEKPPITTELLKIPPDQPRNLIDFSLTDQMGRPVTRGDLSGKIVVFNFFFSGCTLVCPDVNVQMEKIQSLTASMPNVRLISVTLDPTDDTVPVLAKYATQFQADGRHWSFLTGDQNLINNLVGTSFLSKDTTGEFSSMPGSFANSQRIALVDVAGHTVMYFDGLNNKAAEAVVEEIKKMKP